ncbi:hypothetical protein K505DRAFT_284515 [Melanomma pulvis-pyrius CBS 109.77]|uniref:DUF7730 domain-containing protein n=1 Tax=Melanomma pulvis-pyrius CBS 109.77 TaxID=1314802 RepID=A0A6A6WZ51_9PLEO|nr:hypothetical protein K505DRAFT_284515 [Melanomma pulvis-pyrius CBS 109.77]
MSAGLDMGTSVDPQHECKFFVAPAEIRRAIYAHLIPDQIHLFLHEKRLRLSACMQRDKDDHPDCYNRRSKEAHPPNDRDVPDPNYPLRLRSSWGSHWRCEETAKRIREMACETNCTIAATALFLVCKRMFVDFAEMIADIAAFHINDLETLSILDPQSRVLTSAPSFSSMLAACVVPSLKELHINLRLPLSSYEALEKAVDSTGSEPSSMDHSISAWTGLCPAIEGLSELRRLRIWLDHAEPCTWSMVNERAVLSPLAPLSNNPNLDISIDLPKLHPKWEDLDRHYTEDSSPLPLTIHRRYRQRCHGIESSDGSFGTKHSPDFPILYEFTEMYNMTIQEVDDMERKSWERGEDPIFFFVEQWHYSGLTNI